MASQSVIAGCVVVACGVLVGSGQAKDWSVLQPQAAASIVRVSTLLPGTDDVGTCSGIVLDTKGHILTAAHCVADAASYMVEDKHAELVASNHALDLAVLKARKLPKGTTPATFASVSPAAGSDVLVVGYGFSLPNMLTQAGVVASSLEPQCNCILVDSEVFFGQSGGPCFNPQGEVVGMVRAILARGPSHVGMAVPAEVIADFIAPYLEDAK